MAVFCPFSRDKTTQPVYNLFIRFYKKAITLHLNFTVKHKLRNLPFVSNNNNLKIPNMYYNLV